MTTTSRHTGAAADVCRSRGWGPGTRLIGDEGYGPTVIEITAVGDKRMLAKRLGHAGGAVAPEEGQWVLHCRDWRVARDDEIPVPFQQGDRVVHDGIVGTVLSGPDHSGCYVVDTHDGKQWIIRNPRRAGGSES
jgi:hypothetical protein